MNDYTFWQRQLAGDEPELERGRAYPGFYRDREGLPIAIWKDEEGLRYKAGNMTPRFITNEAEFCENAFGWFCRRAVSEENYHRRLQTGRWDDDAPEQMPPSNLPEDPLESLKAQVESNLEDLKRDLKGGITDKESALKFGNWRIRFTEIQKAAEAMRVAEKKPILEEANRIQKRYIPILDLAEEGRRLIADAMKPYLIEQQRQLEEIERNKPAYEEPVPVRASVPTVGKRISLATMWKAEITDYDVALQAFKEHPEIKATVQRLADAAARSKARVPVPGVTFTEIKQAR